MRDFEAGVFIAVFAIIVLVSVSVWRQWLRPGRVSIVLYALAGLAVIALMWKTDIPPDWFDGSGEGWWIAATFFGLAIVSGGAARAFRPFLLAIGVALLALNVWPHV